MLPVDLYEFTGRWPLVAGAGRRPKPKRERVYGPFASQRRVSEREWQSLVVQCQPLGRRQGGLLTQLPPCGRERRGIGGIDAA